MCAEITLPSHFKTLLIYFHSFKINIMLNYFTQIKNQLIDKKNTNFIKISLILILH